MAVCYFNFKIFANKFYEIKIYITKKHVWSIYSFSHTLRLESVNKSVQRVEIFILE